MMQAAPEASPLPTADHGFDAAGWLLAGFAVLVSVAAWTTGYSPFAVPKAAVCLIVLGPGLVALVRLVVAGDRAAWWAVAWLAAATLATAVADEPLMSLTGSYDWLNGLLLTGLLAGVWALGRLARGRSRLVENALLVGAGVNALVAWLATSGQVDYVLLGLFQGRPLGLMSNPVYLGALVAAGLWLALRREGDARPWSGWLLVVVVFVGAIELSGTRAAALAAVIAVAWSVVDHVRRADAARALVLVAVVVAGFFLAQLPSNVDATGSSRLSGDSSRGLSARLTTWGDALDAVLDRPLLGFGPGRTMVAVSPETPLSVARTEGPESYYVDAHNVFVEQLTTTGLLGLACFVAWLWSASRRARGPLLGFALIGGSMLLLEPTMPELAVLLALALGVAGASSGPDLRLFPAASSWPGVITISLASVGVIAGVLLLVGDANYLDSQREQRVAPIDVMDATWPPWPDAPRYRAILVANGARRAADGRRALRDAREALDRDRANPQSWQIVGGVEALWGDPGRARHAYREALRRLPWSAQSLTGLMQLEVSTGHRAAAARYRAKVCRIGREYCPDRSVLDGDGGP
jgi:O-antigen ligase